MSKHTGDLHESWSGYTKPVGVIIRHRVHVARYGNWFRVTVGNTNDMSVYEDRHTVSPRRFDVTQAIFAALCRLMALKQKGVSVLEIRAVTDELVERHRRSFRKE